MSTRKMGRVPLPVEQKREKPLRIRLNLQERELIDQAADGPSAAWARRVLLRQARKDIKEMQEC